MQHRTIPYVSKPVSPIVFGTAGLSAGMSREQAWELLDEVWAAGINCFDCAAIYGEDVLGDWLASRGIRDRAVIVSKCAHPDGDRQRVSEADILCDIRASLEKLQTDYIDMYLLHRDDPNVPVGIVVETLNRLHADGKIGAFGGSNWTHQRIEEANDYAAQHGLIPFSVSSPGFCLAEQVDHPWVGTCVDLSGAKNADARAWYAAHDVAIVAYSALARGFLSGALTSDQPDRAREILDAPAYKGYVHPRNFERLRRAEQLANEKGVTVSQIAFAWLMNQPLRPFAVTATGRSAHLKSTVAAADMVLSPDEIQWLDLTEK